MSFITYQDAFKKEAEFRHNIYPSQLCQCGVKALDDSMIAIAPKEVIVFAGGSGWGKSEMVLGISRHNALNGKRVAHFHLEGGHEEAIQRMKWKDICDLYYKNHAGAQIELDYRKWSLNKDQHPLILKLESEVYMNLKDKLSDKLFFYDNPEGLTYQSFCESLKDFSSLEHVFDINENKMRPKSLNLDLIVIDHIHYFRFPDEQEEIRAMTNIVLTIRDMVDKYRIPVILVAHLRKLPRAHGIPDKEDIYGTSNIHKIANTCIIIHPDHEKDRSAEGLYPTYLRIAKSRIGLRPNELIYCDFNIRTKRYEDDYSLVKCYQNGEVSGEPMKHDEVPRWYQGRLYGEGVL